MFAHLRSVRPHVQRLYDLSAWVVGYFAMAWLQHVVGYSTTAQLRPALLTGLICGLLFVVLAAPLRLHEGRYPIGSFDDALLTSLLGATISVAALVISYYTLDVRVSVAVTGPMCAFVVLLGGRAIYRVFRDWALSRAAGVRRVERRPVVVIGAGNGAAQLVSDMVRDPCSVWLPVALRRRRPLQAAPPAQRRPGGGSDQRAGEGRRAVRRPHGHPGDPERARAPRAPVQHPRPEGVARPQGAAQRQRPEQPCARPDQGRA